MDIKEKLANMLNDKLDIIETPIDEILLSEMDSVIEQLEDVEDTDVDEKYEDIDVSKEDDEDEVLLFEKDFVPVSPNGETNPTSETIKNPVGRPKGIPANDFQKNRVRLAALEYQRKIRDGEIEPTESYIHGAYSFMQNQKIGKKKKVFLRYVNNERKKWVAELGGEENLNAIELSMLNEAARLLMYSTLVNAHLMKGDTEIMFTDENGEVKMHTALSRNYLSFTKTYVSILKELQKLSTGRPKRGGKGKGDVASRLQNLYNK